MFKDGSQVVSPAAPEAFANAKCCCVFEIANLAKSIGRGDKVNASLTRTYIESPMLTADYYNSS